jgi:hypothetical protein
MPGYSYYNTQCGYDIYENENYIPYGFTYDYCITEEECKFYGDEKASNMMLKAMVLNDAQIKKYDGILKRLSEYHPL